MRQTDHPQPPSDKEIATDTVTSSPVRRQMTEGIRTRLQLFQETEVYAPAYTCYRAHLVPNFPLNLTG